MIENAFWQANSTTPRLGDMLHAREARNTDAPWLRFNLLGDPALPVWVKTPQALRVSALPLKRAPQTPPSSAGRYAFRVRSGGHPLANALVVVTQAGQAVTRGSTDAHGQVILDVPQDATIGVSALSTPANPNRAYVPLIRSMRSIALTR